MSSAHRVSPEVTIKNQQPPPHASKLPALTPKPPQTLKSGKTFRHATDGKLQRLPQDPMEHFSPFRRRCAVLLDSRPVTLLMLVVTIYALFGDDLRLSSFTRAADDTFYSLATVCLVLFASEFIVSSYAKPGYLFSFYFALDLIATFSVLPDIGWIWSSIIGDTAGKSSALRASKATRAGSRAGRIVRVVRAVRLFRVVKILKWKHKDSEDGGQEVKESKVGSKMGEVTVQRVVILVLFLIMLLPVFDGGYGEKNYRFQDVGLRAIHMVLTSGAVLEKFRDVEINIVRSQGCFGSDFITWDQPDDTTSTLFIRTARKLVLEPIERMMSIVQKLSENPLASVQTTGNDEEIRRNAKEQGFETALLELTLTKVGTLMQVGFGAAGADIIGKNMGSGDLDPMLPGKKITAIYGFCDIRQFTDTTECLQEDVMVYVNKLGNIMHTGTHHYYGMANKNVGDAFLLSWKICDGELPCFARFTDCPTEEDRVQVNQTVRCPPNAGAGSKIRRITPTEMADSALTAFIKCMIDLDNANTDGPLTEYLVRENVIRRFGPQFRIKMGFGMHVGWAVEGAIGSRFKIDATYISPHVEMADRLEAGSKMFGTPINLSHWLAALLSPGARKFLRKMDRMSIRGVDTPLTVYTFDVTVMKKGFGTPKVDPATGMQQPVDFENDPEYVEIREGLEPAFLESAASAVEAYISGDWAKSRHYLAHAQQIRPNDGPCKHLMGVLKENNFEAPPDWKGYRFVAGY
ncbi:hypothetical protein P43SY_009136 [Pythium insidiosum]|uniref:Voltage-gated Ion Channel (VIC) Superfamily n=1 Tax=Pythium insidiosum TaxID=114742 RepID=A0AAD5MCT2_PYTIN|nr:hypothetical protein P43SY_009136 [Pythium insidiosum]